MKNDKTAEEWHGNLVNIAISAVGEQGTVVNGHDNKAEDCHSLFSVFKF